MKKIELFIGLLVLFIFLILMIKYFQPYLFYEISETIIRRADMELSYLSYVQGLDETEDLVYENNPKGDASSIPVLLYHGISEVPNKENMLIHSFEDQMFALKNAGYETITIEEFYDFIQGKRRLPEKSFLLTFDDGIRSSYYKTDPLLRALDFNAVMFIITKHSLYQGSNYYLSFDEVKQMLESGRWEVQSHGKDSHDLIDINDNKDKGHFLSNKKWLVNENRLETNEEYRARLEKESINSKGDIEEKLGIKIIAFAFPFGDFGQTSLNFPEAQSYVIDEIRKIYPLANFYQVWPSKGFSRNYQDKESFMIKRINVNKEWSGKDILEILENSKEKNLPYKDNFTINNSWIDVWGDSQLINNSLSMEPDPSDTGSFVFLDGSFLWEDYSYSVNVTSMKGKNIGLVVRFNDLSNYAICEFSEDYTRIKQVINGETKILFENNVHFDLPRENFELGVRLQGKRINCLVNDQTTGEINYLDYSLDNGGIGLKIWDPEINNSHLIIKEIYVESIL